YFSYLSPSHSRVLGYELIEFYEQNLIDFVAEDYQVQLKEQLELAIEERATKKVEVKFRRIQEDFQWFELKIEPVFLGDGDYDHTIIVARDIEDRKRYEKDLRRLAFRDPLTGLANRRLFDDRMRRVI